MVCVSSLCPLFLDAISLVWLSQIKHFATDIQKHAPFQTAPFVSH
jgi:hypothetical protein